MGNVKEILKRLEEANEKKYMFNIKPDAGRLLHVLVKIKRPKNIVEVGTANGYSAILIASALKNAKVYTIELNPAKAKEARANFKEAGLKNITLLEGNALTVLKKFNTKVDMVFLDATKKEYLKYLRLLEKNMNDCCVVIADNVISHNEKVGEYLKYVHKNYTSITLHVGSGVELSVKTSPFLL
ncbi:MAG TPA: O-methyltransferase [Candidatus Nanoarchaeia archaeon]|nr:O-methyltransferase [Candidatus Nanoarchaeia archaeon]